MSQQIASLYASLGFNVDQSGLTAFRKEMQTLKEEFVEVLKDTANMNRRLKTMVGRLEQFNKLFNPQNITDWRKRLVASIRRYEQVMLDSRKQMTEFADDVFDAERKLHWFDTRLNTNITTLDTYRQHLEPVVLLLERLRGAAGSPLPRPRGGYGGGSSGNQGGSGSRGQGGGSVGGGLLQAMGVGAFLRPMLPTGMGLGGMLGAGYGFRELVQAGREMQAMEFKLKAVSESSAVFNSNLKYVNETSQSLATNITELGQAYASIFQSAKTTESVESVQATTTGFLKYFKTLNMTPDEIKGSFKAIKQMYNKEKVMAEEITGQLGEKAAGVLQLFAGVAAGGDVKAFLKMMENGKVLADVVTKAGKAAGDWADKQGTLNESLQTSASKQELFNNSLKKMSAAILKGGLDSALADMFMALVPIVEIVGTGLAFVFRIVAKVINGFKALYNYTQEHPIASSVIATTSAFILLMKYFGGWRLLLVNALVSLYRVIIGVGVLNKALLLTKVRLAAVWAAGAALFYLFTELDGFFKGEENNFLMTWYHTLQLLMSEFGVFFAYLKYQTFMFKQSPVGMLRNLFGDTERPSIPSSNPYSIEDKNTRGEELMRNFSKKLQIDTPASVAQQTVASPIENNVYVNLGGLSQQDKAKLDRGETIRVPSNSTSKAIEWGGTGVPKH